MKLIILESQLEELSRIIKEDPDTVEVKDDRGYTTRTVRFDDSDALAFGMSGGKMYVGYCSDLANTKIESIVDAQIKETSWLTKTDFKSHDLIGEFYFDLFDEHVEGLERDTMDFPGRIWLNSKVISFWKYPSKNQLTGLLIKLSKEIYRVYNYKVNFSDYRIEVVDNSSLERKLIPIKEFNQKISSPEDMSKMDLLPSAEKRNTQQMQAVKKDNVSYLEKKFPEDTIQAQWNAAKNKYRGESVETKGSELSEDINIPITTGDTVLMGKFKNKKTIVNSIGKDDWDMPTINGKKATTFRIPKKIEKDNIETHKDGVSHLNEVEISDVDMSSFEIKKELNTKFWTNKKLNSKVRRRLLKIADDFLDFINVDSKYCKDILFLGSLANYNWSRYSDIDLHLMVDFKKINLDIELVRDYFDTKRKLWASEHESLKIYGFSIEIYIQDINEVNASTGIFSLEKNKWLKIPKEDQEEILNINKIKQKSADIMTKIDDFKSKYDKKLQPNELDAISKKVKILFDSIKSLRKSGLESKSGEFSVGNIVFKILRRSEHMATLVDLKINTYDKINTIK